MARRVETDRLRELVRLHRIRTSAREVTRLLRIGPNVARRYRVVLAAAGLLDGAPNDLPALEVLRAAVDAALPRPTPPRPASSVQDHWPQIRTLLEKGLGPRATFDRLRAEAAFAGSYSAIKRACRQLRREQLGDHVAVPVDSAPGEILQVDFGYAGKLFDPAAGVLRRAWVFVAVCGFSRLMVVRLVFDQRIETWLRLHEEAFAELGGVVETVVPDNTRRAVLRAAFDVDGTTELNRSYRELAQRYGFKIDPTPPRAPRLKGKAEAAVKFLRNNPLKGRDGEPMDQVQSALARWNRDVASTRVHGTTRRRPIDAFEQAERAALRPLPQGPSQLAVWKRAKVHPDCHIAFAERLFSVPWPLVSAHVWLRATEAQVELFHDDHVVATHPRHGPRRATLEEHLPPDRRDLRHRGRAFWVERATRIGPETTALVHEVFDLDDVLSHLRRVQAIVKHLECFPRPRAEATSKLLRQTGNLTYFAAKDALARGLDLISFGSPPGRTP